ncbi:hypothetical protein KAFR_0C01170 [Kazachstania africana CBS 2517]|uniref:Pre-mRNA-splicing factor 38 n=1 Tax=Kazachstania africana (strain ATCC 22294 / BCRC 22015 / CBS 2517 / CECT 1963 / NBRC 1671 / NRRL Y-8276) TaxID=1071382 RepID=H2ARW2_KAZAF|nr:hypothetical protein KAFR_0C01170 [Kazachstania africana CBS 2517]CCF57112.1 hypothetical protein KAFR_0C01170 [Kazachstania africana CBS 2517]
MSSEFHVESFLSAKQLNHQSVSLIIPRLTRDRIHNNIYYKVNLQPTSLRGDTLLELSKVIIRDLGTLKDLSVNKVHVLGGMEFKCLLMKLIEIRPTINQLFAMLNPANANTNFEDKYITALIITYLRIQYFYLTDAQECLRMKNLFKKCIKDYRKLKSLSLQSDCWSPSEELTVAVVHMDELTEWLVSKEQIWGIPLGKCQWADIFDDDSDVSSASSSSFESDYSDSEGKLQ